MKLFGRFGSGFKALPKDIRTFARTYARERVSGRRKPLRDLIVMIAVIFTVVGIVNQMAIKDRLVIFSKAASYESDLPAYPANPRNRSFQSVKHDLLAVYARHRVTFYCGCDFNRGKRVRCTNGTQVQGNRGQRIEWEHIVPASWLGRIFPEWKNGHPRCRDERGRECVARVRPLFNRAQTDMYNLVPAIGAINNRRSNYPFGIVPGEPRAFGTCNMEIEDRTAEPPNEMLGNIARTYLYMSLVYPGLHVLDMETYQMFKAWDAYDPVDRWECERAHAIERTQGNENPYVKYRCLLAGLWP